MSAGVTVVIPSLDRESYVIDAIESLLAEKFRPLEILVVDQSDKPSQVIRELGLRNPAEISYHHVSFRGLPIARNFGWQRARHDVIIFIDDDVKLMPGLITEHLHAHRESGVGIVGGGIVESRGDLACAATGKFVPWTATPIRGFDATGTFDVDHAPGGNFSVKRDVFKTVGGIDEGLDLGAALYEETDFCLRVRSAGFRVLFHGQARLVHLAAERGGCRVPDKRRYLWSLARNRCLLMRRYLRWYHYPTALARLGITAISTSLRSRDPEVLIRSARGVIDGLLAADPLPRFTLFPEE